MVRSGTFYFRSCVPKDLAAAFGKRLVLGSLRTIDLKMAPSKLPYFIVAAETEFDTLRQAIHGSTPDTRNALQTSAEKNIDCGSS
jgi:hypothetical protein